MKKSNPFVTTALLIVLVGLIGFLLLVRPARASVDKAQGELDQVTDELADVHQRIAALKPDPDDTEFAELVARIPRTLAESELIGQLHSLAGSTGVVITDVQIAEPTAPGEGPGSQSNVDITAEGDAAPIDAFLAGLAAVPRLTIITDVALRHEVRAGSNVADGAPDDAPALRQGDEPLVAPAAQPTPPVAGDSPPIAGTEQLVTVVDVTITVRSGLDVSGGA